MVHQNCLLDPRWWPLSNTAYSITQLKFSLIGALATNLKYVANGLTLIFKINLSS